MLFRSKVSRWMLLLLVGSSAIVGTIVYWRGQALAKIVAHTPTVPSVSVVNDEPERIARSGQECLDVPPKVARKMRLQTESVTVANTPVSMPTLQGVLALDNDRLSRVHSRFGGEVVELGSCAESADHSLHVGDFVHQGDLLAVVWSTELGEKKSALVDAMVKARAEEQLLEQIGRAHV